MTAPVLTIPQEMSLREAASLLSHSHISGAPVVDAEGQCIGVLSSSDFVTWAGEGGEAASGGSVTGFIAPWGEWIDIEDSPDTEIRHYMTALPVKVAGATPIAELAQRMVADHIHRVLVVGDQNRPRGIVTRTDVRAAVARMSQSVPQASESPRPRSRKRS
jgi:CBS domain-containing protein